VPVRSRGKRCNHNITSCPTCHHGNYATTMQPPAY